MSTRVALLSHVEISTASLFRKVHLLDALYLAEVNTPLIVAEGTNVNKAGGGTPWRL